MYDEKAVKYLPHSTKLTLYKLMSGSKLKLVLNKVFLALTQYKIDVDLKNSRDIVFLINHERVYRQDHIEQFRYIYDTINNTLGYKSTYFEIKRVLNWNLISIVKTLIKNKTFFNIINAQMNDLLMQIQDDRVKSVVVFCDTVPLQNYICEFYNKNKISTYSLQHGFYIPDDNKIFELVYKSSNAKNFFIWDKRTLKYMQKHEGNKKRNFILAGPISKQLYTKDLVESKKSDELKSIAIYGCGKDQILQNEYLVDLYKYLKVYTELKIVFISHPRFKLFFRLLQSYKYKIWFGNNKKKYGQYDLHLVLNSGVWLELEEKGERYYLLNHDFDNKISFLQTYTNCLKHKNPTSGNELQPFFKDMEVIERIQNNIIDNMKGRGNDI